VLLAGPALDTGSASPAGGKKGRRSVPWGIPQRERQRRAVRRVSAPHERCANAEESEGRTFDHRAGPV